MKYHKGHLVERKGFTLVELLTVISIIAILAGILIPTVTTAMKNVNLAKGQAQLKGYAMAVTQFRLEYGYYPSFFDMGSDDMEWEMDSMSKQEQFLEGITARDESGGRVAVYGNKKAISFLELSDGEFDMDTDRIVDPFNSSNIHFLLDGDNNGRIDSRFNPAEDGGDIRARVLLFSVNEEDEDFNIYTWDIDFN